MKNLLAGLMALGSLSVLARTMDVELMNTTIEMCMVDTTVSQISQTLREYPTDGNIRTVNNRLLNSIIRRAQSSDCDLVKIRSELDRILYQNTMSTGSDPSRAREILDLLISTATNNLSLYSEEQKVQVGRDYLYFHIVSLNDMGSKVVSTNYLRRIIHRVERISEREIRKTGNYYALNLSTNFDLSMARELLTEALEDLQ